MQTLSPVSRAHISPAIIPGAHAPGFTLTPASQVLRRLLTVNHPRNAESIDAHAEARRPERRLKRHRHTSVLSQSVEDTLSFGDVFQVQRHIHSLRLLVT